jgi:hypothetical protein
MTWWCHSRIFASAKEKAKIRERNQGSPFAILGIVKVFGSKSRENKTDQGGAGGSGAFVVSQAGEAKDQETLGISCIESFPR